MKMQSKTRRIVAIDFFCGAGGLTRGLLDSGIQVLAGIDNDSRLKDTYEKNNLPSIFIEKDICTIDITELRKSLGIQVSDIVVYAACAPCQPFSTLTRKHGDDSRKELLLAFGKLVRAEPPDFIIVENVPGLHNAIGRNIFDEFNAILDESGFSARFSEELNAKDYGVAQVRKRFLMLASRHGYIERPKKARWKMTVQDAIKKFPPLQAGESDENVFNHKTQALLPHLLRIIQAIPKNGGSRSDVPDTSILLKCHQNKPKVHKDVFGRMAWNLPAPTMTCRCLHVYCGRFVHPEQDRGLSLREAAAIQSFPDNYVFYGKSDMHIAKQIGNAVPVELAKRVGLALVSASKQLEKMQ
jgi:DNA (cytosine-5)-methyltransferase 1